MIFLMDYHRASGSLVGMQAFPEDERATAERLRLELEIRLLRSGTEREVVLLEAESEAGLRRTHRRYFEDLSALSRP